MCGTTERAELLLPMTPASPGVAREFARSNGCTEHASQVLDEALLLISELVTNSVLHGGPTILLSVECDGSGGLKVRVRDGSATAPQRRTSSPEDENGRGLALVDVISDAWGVEPVDDEYGTGKTVWFELRPPRADVR